MSAVCSGGVAWEMPFDPFICVLSFLFLINTNERKSALAVEMQDLIDHITFKGDYSSSTKYHDLENIAFEC